MSKVVIGIAAVIVLAAAVLAIVHFLPGSKTPEFTAQNGWIPVKSAGSTERGPMRTVGTFGAWRLLCKKIAPDAQADMLPSRSRPGEGAMPARKGRCAVALLMRKVGTTREWFNLRFQQTTSGAVAVLFYAHGHAGQTFVPTPTAPGDEIDLIADQNTARISTDRCIKGICMALMELPPGDVDIIVAAHSLTLRFPAAKPKKADDAPLPTDGLKAAFAALRQQPA